MSSAVNNVPPAAPRIVLCESTMNLKSNNSHSKAKYIKGIWILHILVKALRYETTSTFLCPNNKMNLCHSFNVIRQ